jgi:APA family basic amino acid/polyamine antiporter
MQTFLCRRKPIDALIAENTDPTHRHLKRTMNVWSIMALGVGATIGTGIFVLTGKAAAISAGPGIVLSFVLSGVISMLAALCYAELASTIPVSGSAYTYVYATLGEVLAWIVGWGLILEYALGAATVAIGWSGYFSDFLHVAFGIVIPRAFSTNPFEGGILNLPAAIIILCITGLLMHGTTESDSVNRIVVTLKLAVVAFFIAMGAQHINPANWHPFLPFGWQGVINGASLVFFAYIGFDAVSTCAEEVTNPQRDLPRGILGSLCICTLLYIVVSGILTGIVPFRELDVPSPVSFALIHIGLGWAGAIIAVGAIAGLTTVLLALLYGQSRIFFVMSRDGLLPDFFSRIHPKFQTPYYSSLGVGIVVAIIASIGKLEVVADLVNIGTLVAFAFVSIGVIVLRRIAPDLKRGFRVPWSPVIPILSAAGSLALIAKGLPLLTMECYLAWLVLGLLLYFLHGRHSSKLTTATTL